MKAARDALRSSLGVFLPPYSPSGCAGNNRSGLPDSGGKPEHEPSVGRGARFQFHSNRGSDDRTFI